MLVNLFNSLPRVDLFSLLLGLVLGAALYIVIIRLINIFSQVKSSGKRKNDKHLVTSSSKLLNQFLVESLKRSQSDHLLGAVVPLSDIYISMPLIYPYQYVNPKSKPADAYEASSLLPYLPELAELYESVPFNSTSLLSALRDHRLLLIQGDIGSGKTTTINNTISSILEKKEDSTQFHGYLPFYFHYSEIDNLASYPEREPFQPLLDTQQFRIINSSKSLISSTFLPFFVSGKAVLFVDGLDETNPSTISAFSAWIKVVISKFPLLKIVIANNLVFSDDFQKMGFTNFFISPVNVGMRKEITQKLTLILTKLQLFTNNSSTPLPVEMEFWERQNSPHGIMPLITMQFLSDFSFSGIANSTASIISSYIKRFCSSDSQLDELINLSQKMSENPLHLVKKDEIINLLGNKAFQSNPQNSQYQEKSFFESLAELSILIERQPGQYSFRSILVYSYLLSQNINKSDNSNWEHFYFNPVENLVLSFNQKTDYLNLWLCQKNIPFHKNIDLLKCHFEKLKTNPELLKKSIPYILSALQDSSLCFPIKLKYLLLLTKLDNETIVQVLDFLFSKGQKGKLFSILGYGFINSSKSVNFLKQVLTSGSPLEKAISALSLCRLNNTEARQTVISSLQTGDDLYRRLVCEMLSTDYLDGAVELKVLSSNANIATRKSSIFGIKQIKAPWIAEFLANMSTNEGEWIVRDAAAAALEEISTHKIELSNTTPTHPSTLDWLISAADEKGQGVSVNSIPIELLKEIINNGQINEKLSSLFVLSSYPSKDVNAFLISLFENETDVSDQAFFYSSEMSKQENSF